MTLHQLRLFVAVSQYKNITAASNKLFISQPAVSRQLKLLAEECRVRLYRAHGRGIELTPAGRSFLDNVRPLLNRFKELERFGVTSRENKATSLSIGGSHTPCAFLLPALVSHFKKSHAKVQVVLRCDSSSEVEKMVRDSEVELAFVARSTGLPDLLYKTCREDEIVAFASVTDPMTANLKHEWSLKQLAEVPLVVKRDETCREPFMKCFQERGLSPNFTVECELPQMVIEAVKKHAGIGILKRDTVEEEVKNGVLKIIRVKNFSVHAYTFAAYKRGTLLSPNALDFLRLANRQLRKLPNRTLPIKAA